MNELLPRQCPCCGKRESFLPFTDRTYTASVGPYSSEVTGLAGCDCSACGEILFEEDSAKRFADAGDALILRLRRKTGWSE